MQNKNCLFFFINNFLKIPIISCILLILINHSLEEECEKSRPIKKSDNKCYLTFCTKTQFEQGECEISNPIIKTQWLTNMINVGEEHFRYLNFALSSKNDLILYTISKPPSSNNYFYGLKSNGRPYFTIDGKPSNILCLTIIYYDVYYRFNKQMTFLYLNNNEKQYLMSLVKNFRDFELYDLEKNIVTSQNLNSYVVISKKNSIIYFVEDNTHYYFFAFLSKVEENNNIKYYLVIQLCTYNYDYENDKITLYSLYNKAIENSNNFKSMISCYRSEKKNIICFHYNQDLNYSAILYDEHLNEKNSFDFAKPTNDTDLYFNCIHFKGEIGIFYYFLNEKDKPIIDIVEFIQSSDNSNYIRKYLFQSLKTKNINIDSNIHINSITKLNDNKFGIIQINNITNNISIIIYHLYNDNTEIITRYYTIDLWELYGMKVAFDVESVLYNSFFVSAFSLLESRDYVYNYYTYLIMFSYPNATDYEINLINHLKNYNCYFDVNEIINDKIQIENNIFGLVKKGIIFQNFPEINNGNIISLYLSNKSRIINKNDIIYQDDEIEFFFLDSKLNSDKYIIEYAGVVTEPDFDEYNLYCDIDSDNGNIEVERKEFTKREYIGKTGYIYLNVDQTLSNQCSDKNCFYCLESNIDNCILYRNRKGGNSLDEKELTAIYNKLVEIIEKKTFEGETIIMDMKDILMQLSTIDFQEGNIKDKNSTNVFLGECKDILKEKYNLQENEILLMLKLDLFKQNSSTPLVEYEIYNYNNSEKLNLDYCKDIRINVFFPIQLDNRTIILYNNLNLSGYNLFDSNDSFYNDICSVYTTINGTDITLIDRKNAYYNQSLSLCQEEGCIYDYYDCQTNKIKCNCSISKTSVEKQDEKDNSFISTIVEIYNNKEIIKDIFSLSIENMNFQVMKCFKLLFKSEHFIKNIGCILLTIFIFIYLLLMILYFIFGNKILQKIMFEAFNKKYFTKKKSIVHFRKNDNNNNKNINKGKKDVKLKKIKTFAENAINNQIIKNTIVEDDDKSKSKNNSNNNILLFQRGKLKKYTSKFHPVKLKLNCPPPKYEKKQSIKVFRKLNKAKTLKVNNQLFINKLESKIDSDNKKKDKMIYKNFIKNVAKDVENNLNSNNSRLPLNQRNNDSLKNKRKGSVVSIKNDRETKDEKDAKERSLEINKIKNYNLPNAESLTDQELNNLDYGTAVIIDKRTFLQYYWSLLKKRHLILFAFYPANDYNIMIIKVSFFIVSFSLYMTINCFFFSDESMHKVYENNGEFNIIYQIPQILYSTIVSMVINKLLKYLCLSEKSILDLKKEKSKKTKNGKSEKIEKCLKIKLIIYFGLGFLFMLFFWYFISTFCAVYTNTQAILIKNTLISFGLSMIYPFGYEILPGILRIPALRAKNQDQEFLYKLSKIIALI